MRSAFSARLAVKRLPAGHNAPGSCFYSFLQAGFQGLSKPIFSFPALPALLLRLQHWWTELQKGSTHLRIGFMLTIFRYCFDVPI